MTQNEDTLMDQPMHNQTIIIGRAEHKLYLLCCQVAECGATAIETKVRFQDSVLDMRQIKSKNHQF